MAGKQPVSRRKPTRSKQTASRKPALARRNPRRPSPQGGSLRHFFTLRPVLWFIFLSLAAGLLYWQWEAVTRWFNNVGLAIWYIFDWGTLLIILAVLVSICVIFQKPLIEFARRYHLYRWNRWLGGLALLAAVWGTLGLLGVGGRVGLAITGHDVVDYPLWASLLQLAGFYVLGILFCCPALCWRGVCGLCRGIGRTLKRRPAPLRATAGVSRPAGVSGIPQSTFVPRATPQQIPLPETDSLQGLRAMRTAPDTKPEDMPSEGLEGELVPGDAVTPSSKNVIPDAEQVARDVWRKYGESPALVTVDGWKLPPVEILENPPEAEYSQADSSQRAHLIEEALSSYGVEAKVVQINSGPTVTQFGVEPGWDRRFREVKEKDKDGKVTVRQEETSRTRVKVDRITSLSNDIALALSAPTIRIEAPVPGKPIVGIEVPNNTSTVVSLRGVIETTNYQRLIAKAALALALGKGAGGEAVSGDLAKMPHLLIAGATGSGKTVCLNTIICCLLMHNTPNDLKLLMIDPKRVELTPFNSIPHLAAPVIVDADRAVATLRWLSVEMDRRYQQLAKVRARNIEAYNKNRTGDERMSFLVLVVDELADLMMAGF